MKLTSLFNPATPLQSYKKGFLSYGSFIQKTNNCSKCQLFNLSEYIENTICKPCRIKNDINHTFDMISFDNDNIFEHSKKVSYLSFMLGKKLKLNRDILLNIKLAGLYHDIGKTRIPDQIINKPSHLNMDEWAIMKSHSSLGYEILKSDSHLSKIAEYVKYHHERVDGHGYPNGLVGNQIPLISRIISIVDAYDAMTSDRPYRKALTKDEAIEELIANAGTQFDQEILNVFINNVLN